TIIYRIGKHCEQNSQPLEPINATTNTRSANIWLIIS
ncbi:MAG: hypothetical protein ACI80S_001524, partial [Pseudohongiellaceae bacterium]